MTNSPAGKEAVLPTGSLVLVGACCGVFAMVSLGQFPKPLAYAVNFSSEMQPLQWFTSLFIHVNLLQLAACLAFLLIVGSLIEARLRFWWTISLFIGLGAAGQAIAQMALLDQKPGGFSLGAAAGVCGWAGLLLVWSPFIKATHISKVSLGKASTPIWALVLAWMVITVGVTVMVLGPNSLLPQLVSFLAGAVTSVVLLKNKIIEGEHQDLLTMIAGTAPGGRKERKKQMLKEQSRAEAEEQIHQQIAAAQQQLEAFLSAGQFAGAITLLRKMADVGDGLQVSRVQLTSIIRGLHKQNKWEESIPWLQQYLERFPEDVAMRLKLAQIFVVDQRLPGSGMEVLKPLLEMQLPEAEEKLLRKLERAACNMYEDDDIELEVEKRSW